MDIATSLDVPNLFLVVNKALTRYDFNQIREQVEGFYDQPVASVLPLSEDLVDLGSSDIFSLCFPDHPWSKGIQKVASAILEAN